MIETIFTLEDTPMTPETDAPEEGGTEGGGEEMPASEPAGRFDDEGGESSESTETEARLEDGEGEKSDDEE